MLMHDIEFTMLFHSRKPTYVCTFSLCMYFHWRCTSSIINGPYSATIRITLMHT